MTSSGLRDVPIIAYQAANTGGSSVPKPCAGREPVTADGCKASVQGATLCFDASGKDGARGRDGQRGAQDGSDGTRGSPGAPGSHGGSAVICLQGDGSGFLANGSRYEYANVEKIVASAVGGKGGEGGSGGDGAQGAPGRRGQDATAGSKGEDGGPGGRGGNGGPGGDGGAGGKGGMVVVATQEEHAYLLMMMPMLAESPGTIAEIAKGGTGGHGGAGGLAGLGGLGGQGGSGGRFQNGSGTDYNQPGGQDGAQGASGRPGKQGQKGRNGDGGVYGIQVNGIEYACRYNLRCKQFAVVEDPAVEESHDGVFEFGEVIACNDFNLENPNEGSMSTPTIHQRAQISLAGETKWTTAVSGDVFVGPGVRIEGLQTHAVPRKQALRCLLKYPDLEHMGPDFDAVEVQDSINIRGVQLGHKDHEDAFQREYGDFGASSAQTLTARFPVMNLNGIDALAAIAPGERCVVRFHVRNLSRLALGDAEGRGRKVVVRWAVRDSTQAESSSTFVDVRDEEEREATLPLVVNLSSVPALGTDFVQIQVGWKEDTPDFSEVALQAALGIEAPTADAWEKAGQGMRWVEGEVKGTDVQRRQHTLRCVPRFALPKGYSEAPAAAIVIYSPGAPSDLCKVWVDVLRNDFDMPTAVWNMARYGHFDPSKDETLQSMVSGSRSLLVVVFDYPFQHQAAAAKSRQETALPSDLLDQSILRRALPTSQCRILLVSKEKAEMRKASKRLNFVVDLDTGAGAPSELHWPAASREAASEIAAEGGRCVAACIAHSIWQCGLPEGYNRRLVTKLAQRCEHDLVVVHPARRGVVVCQQGVPERKSREHPKCIFRRAWGVGSVEVLVNGSNEPEDSMDSWDPPLEAFAASALPDAETSRRRLRSLRWIVAAALPRAAKVGLLLRTLRSVREAAECGKDADNFEELSCMLDVHVAALLHEMKRDIQAAVNDPGRAVDKCTPTLDLLEKELLATAIPALPKRSASNLSGHAAQCYSLTEKSVWMHPISDVAVGKVVDVELAAKVGPAAVDTQAGILVHIPQAPMAKVNRWVFNLHVKHQVKFMFWEWWQWLLFMIGMAISFGLLVFWLLSQPHIHRFKRLAVLALPPGSGLTCKSHAAALNAARELLCGLQLLQEEAKQATSEQGTAYAMQRRRTLPQRLRDLSSRLEDAGLLPGGSWVPFEGAPTEDGKKEVKAFLKRRLQGLKLQGKIMELLSFDGWSRQLDLAGQECSDAVMKTQGLEVDVPPQARTMQISALEWQGLQTCVQEIRSLSAGRSGNIVEKHSDMIVTDDTVFTTCALCNRRIPERHLARHEVTECRKRQQGLEHLKTMVSTRASQKLLSDENLSALEAACEEGASALTEEERTRFTDLLRYIRLERRLEKMLHLSDAALDVPELEQLLDGVRTLAAGRALHEDVQGVYAEEGQAKLCAAVQLQARREFESLKEDGVLAAAAIVLAESKPPSGTRRQAILKAAFSERQWALREPAGHSSSSSSPKDKNVEIADDALMTRTERLFKFLAIAKAQHLDLPAEMGKAAGQVALADLWLAPKHQDALSQRLQFCRNFHLRQDNKYKARAEELRELKKMPTGWDLDSILEKGGARDIAKLDMSDGLFVAAFQALFNMTFQSVYTRDRRGGKVPTSIEVVSVRQVLNLPVWQNYVLFREQVQRSTWRRVHPWPSTVDKPITNSWLSCPEVQKAPSFLEPLRTDVNEAWLFHGTSFEGAEGITDVDFSISMAGSSAGTLYGRGVYLAECCSKSDEYCRPNSDGLRVMLVCRATLGNVYYTAERSPNPGELERQCGYLTKKPGKYHSVLGDRKKAVNTYREFIVFDSDLVYPAFIVIYRRK